MIISTNPSSPCPSNLYLKFTLFSSDKFCQPLSSVQKKLNCQMKFINIFLLQDRQKVNLIQIFIVKLSLSHYLLLEKSCYSLQKSCVLSPTSQFRRVWPLPKKVFFDKKWTSVWKSDSFSTSQAFAWGIQFVNHLMWVSLGTRETTKKVKFANFYFCYFLWLQV